MLRDVDESLKSIFLVEGTNKGSRRVSPFIIFNWRSLLAKGTKTPNSGDFIARFAIRRDVNAIETEDWGAFQFELMLREVDNRKSMQTSTFQNSLEIPPLMKGIRLRAKSINTSS